MKTTGIIRKIDELGRIVIPKEIRKSLSLKNNDNLEILLEDENIVLKKYQPMGRLLTLAKSYSKTLSDLTGFSVCITDTEKVIAISGEKKEKYIGEAISEYVVEVMNERIIWSTMERSTKNILLSTKEEEYVSQIIAPIICDAEAIGTVILFSKETGSKITDLEFKLVQLTSQYLGAQLE
ncbi:MAG: stage V sporulation T C-terminal domain-containing protein [Clostridia bacterium]|nr:stage V sporulation T C-terminal domain-containing protein [Clostridia bacterium]